MLTQKDMLRPHLHKKRRHISCVPETNKQSFNSVRYNRITHNVSHFKVLPSSNAAQDESEETPDIDWNQARTSDTTITESVPNQRRQSGETSSKTDTTNVKHWNQHSKEKKCFGLFKDF